METKNRKITLGFTNQDFEQGVHICQIFNDDNERHSALVNFLVSGLKAGENTACFSEKETEDTLSEYFGDKGYKYKAIEKSGDFSLSKASEVYFEGGRFEPDNMLKLLKEFYEKALFQKKTGARVIGEMSAEIQHIPGGSRLLEYESRVSLLLKKNPVTSVCQYDVRKFDGATIMDILKVHPYMIVRGSVVNNPFFIQPEEFLSINAAN